MIPRTNHSRAVPILIWREERAKGIPILHLAPDRAAPARWLRPMDHPWRRKRFIFLNRPDSL